MPAVPPLCAVVTVLLITPGLLYYFDITPKAAVLLITVALMLIPASRWIPELGRRRETRWFALLLAAQLVSLLASTAFSSDSALSIGGSNWRRMGLISHAALILFALISAAYLASDVRRLHHWLRLFAVAGIIAAIYGCAQYAGWDPLLPSASYHVGEGEWTIARPPSVLGHASYAATFYLHAVFAGVALATVTRDSWRYAGIGAAGLCSAAIVLSGTRAAILGLCLGFTLVLFARRPKLRAAHGVIAASIVAGAVLFYYSPYGLKLRSRTRWYVEDARGGPRLWLWRDAVSMGASRTLTGWGPEVFPAEFPRHQSIELSRAFPDFYHESPHNILLDAWTAQGLPGLAILLALSALALRPMRRSPAAAGLCAGFAAALLAQQFTSFTLATALCFYATAALIISAEAGAREADPPRLRIHYALLPVSGVLIWYAVALVVSDRLQLEASRHLAAGRLREGVAAYEKTRAWQPPGVNSDLWFSRAAFEAARRSSKIIEAAETIRAAGEAASRAASQAEDRANAAYNLAALQATQGNAAAVEESLRAAIRTAPNWYKPHWALARLLLMSGRSEEAAAEIRTAIATGGGVHAEVRQTQKDMSLKE